MERIQQILLSIKKASLKSGEITTQDNEIINVVQGSNSYYIKRYDLLKILKLYTNRDPKNLIKLKYLDLDKVISTTSHKRFNLPSNKNRFEIKNIGSKELSKQPPLEQKEENLSLFISEFKSKASLKANRAKSALTYLKNGLPLKKIIPISAFLLVLFFSPQLFTIFYNESKITEVKSTTETKNKQEKKQIAKTFKKPVRTPSPPRKKQNQLKRIKRQIKKIPKVARPQAPAKKEKKLNKKDLNNRDLASSKEEDYSNQEIESDEYEIEGDEKEIKEEKEEEEEEEESQLEPEIEVNSYEENYKDDSSQNNYDNDSYENDNIKDNYPENDEYLDD
ncbi:MAG: hypothetical protein CME61_01430 [Halobacteriovoraceae bacterium]|nr:hypothetical protein [Halobacteriovoraceae bacterium]